jgi:hypothetical protein
LSSVEGGSATADAAFRRRLEVTDEGRVVCWAEVTVGDGPAAKVSLHSESGHIPPGSRGRLVDDVLELPEVEQVGHIEASVPRGDSESLYRLQERCDQVTTHCAGVTVLVSAELNSEP